MMKTKTTCRRLLLVLALVAASTLLANEQAVAAATQVAAGAITVDGDASDWAGIPFEFDTGPRPCDPDNLGSWDLSGAKGRFAWDGIYVYALFEAYPNTCGPGANPNGPFDAINIEIYINALGFPAAFFLSECPDFDPFCSNPDLGEMVVWSVDLMTIELKIPIAQIVDTTGGNLPSPYTFSPPGDFLEYRVRIGDPDSAGGFDSRDTVSGFDVLTPPETSGGFRRLDFAAGPPTSKDQCKKGGWMTFTVPTTFKNQGQCVRFVETGKF